jgi:16S rRNA (guanine527-N7)-methyltransferase
MGPDDFARATGVSRETLEKLKIYQQLLEKWQPKINLVGPATLADAWRRHFDDSAQIFPFLRNILQERVSHKNNAAPQQDIDSTPQSEISANPHLPPDPVAHVDLGSGAGFPGLVLAIMAQGEGLPLKTHLVESDQRKCAFLIEVARAANVAESLRVHPKRAQALAREGKIKADLVTARALAPLTELLELAAPFLKPRGECLFLKGERVDDELISAARAWKIRSDRIASRSGAGGVILRVREFTRA